MTIDKNDYNHGDGLKLVGEVLASIDDFGDELLLTTESGRKFRVYHSQNCCENVGIVGQDGDFHSLIGKKIVEVDVETEGDSANYDGYQNEGFLATNFIFRTSEHTVISKWIGTSNGYYGVGVKIEEIT